MNWKSDFIFLVNNLSNLVAINYHMIYIIDPHWSWSCLRLTWPACICIATIIFGAPYVVGLYNVWFNWIKLFGWLFVSMKVCISLVVIPLISSLLQSCHTVFGAASCFEKVTGLQFICHGVLPEKSFFVDLAALCSWCGTWKGEKVCSSCKQARYCSEKHQVP